MHTSLRQLKDAIFVKLVGNVSVLVWLKAICVLPMSIFFTYMFGLLRQRYSSDQRRVILSISYIFIVLFAFFAFISFPYIDQIHFPHLGDAMHKFGNAIHPSLGYVLYNLGSILGFWSLSIFFAVAETWGAIAISMIAWGAANDVTNGKEANVFYSVFGTISNLGCAIASHAMFSINFSSLKINEIKYSGQIFMIIMIALTMLMMWCYNYTHNIAMQKQDEEEQALSEEQKQALALKAEAKKKVQKMPFIQMLGKLFTDSYLLNIGILVAGYNICITMIDFVWKDQVVTAFGSKAYSSFHSMSFMLIGIVTMFTSALSAFFVRYFPWITKAMLTLLMLACTTALFFGLVLFTDSTLIKNITHMFNFSNPVHFAILIGMVQSIAIKSLKYTLFDSSKEQLFRVGSEFVKYEGKSIVDIAVNRVTKSLGGNITIWLGAVVPLIPIAFIQNPLWSINKKMVPIIAMIVMALIIMWAFAVMRLSGMYAKACAESLHYEEDNGSSYLSNIFAKPYVILLICLTFLSGVYYVASYGYHRAINKVHYTPQKNHTSDKVTFS